MHYKSAEFPPTFQFSQLFPFSNSLGKGKSCHINNLMTGKQHHCF